MSNKVNKLALATDTFKELAFVYFTVILISSALFSMFEDKSFFQSLWWSFVTAMTVGYGDMYPVTLGGKIVAVVLMHAVIFFIAPLVVARLIQKLYVDENEFSNTEQEEIMRMLKNVNSYTESQQSAKRSVK